MFINFTQTHSARHVLALFFSLLMSFGLTGCAALPSDVQRPVTTALENNLNTRLGKDVAARAAATSTRNDSGFALVGSAELAFTSRMTLIKAAEKTLDLQYYAVHADNTTDRLFEALREAAARGVRVRILLDDFNTAGKDAQVLRLAFENNIEMRLFNPLPSNRSSAMWRIISSLSDAARLQRRMHNKIFVADNAVAITGGRNLGDTYFGQSDGVNFVDIDVLASGRIARDLSRSFDQYWNNPLAYPVKSLMTAKDLERLKPLPAAQAASFGEYPPTQPTATPSEASNKNTVGREAVNPAGISTTPAALTDTTDLRLLSWTWAASTMLVDKPSKIAEDADTT